MSNTTTPTTPTKKERREAARAARLERERREAAAQARKRRLARLGAVAAAALAVVAVAIALSSSGGDDPGGPAGGELAGVSETRELLAGIPQDGLTLGDPGAPVTLVEFVDPQCPFCRQYALEAQPELIERYVRPGRVKVQLQPLHFLGPDSEKAARAIVAAGEEGRAWHVADLAFHNQGAENSGYVDDAWLRGILRAAGTQPAEVLERAAAPATDEALRDAQAMATRYGRDSTPSFLVGRTGGELRPVELQALSADELAAAIDPLLPGS